MSITVPACSIAPYSRLPAGTHRLWLVAVARLALPATIRVEARHDLVGIRLAQVALGFGADVLSGPIESDRHLPVAGVTRPNEATLAGLRKIRGIGKAKPENYGQALLELLHPRDAPEIDVTKIDAPPTTEVVASP